MEFLRQWEEAYNQFQSFVWPSSGELAVKQEGGILVIVGESDKRIDVSNANIVQKIITWW